MQVAPYLLDSYHEQIVLNFLFLLEWNANCKSSFSALHDEVVMSHCLIMKDV